MAEVKVQSLTVVDKVLTAVYGKIGKKLVIDLNKLADYSEQAEIHGWKQRFGDLKSGDDTGAAKYAEAKRLYEHLLGGGDWNMSGERDTTGVVIAALNRINPAKYPIETLTKAAEAKPDQVKVWRSNVQVRAMIAKIYAEKAAAAAKVEKPEEIVIEV